MKVGLHWRMVAWNLVLVVLAWMLLGLGVAGFVLFAATLLVFGIYIRSRVSAPLERLRDRVRRLGRGEDDSAIPSAGDPLIRDVGDAVRDLTESLSSRIRELSDSRAHLESVLGAMADGVLVFDTESRITLANESIQSLLSTPRDLIGQTCLDAFRNEEFDQAVRGVFAVAEPRCIELHPNEAQTIRVQLAPVFAQGQGRAEAVTAVLHDLTEIRQTERIRTDFVANVSHEFKTPLTSIRGSAETLLSESEGEESATTGFLRMIDRNARHLESLVGDLLELARLEAELPSRTEHVDVGSIVRDQLALRHASSRALMKVEVDCPPFEVRADPSRLTTAIANLLDNAVAHNRPDGKIQIAGRVEGAHFVLEVADSGDGIPQHELPRIFERFYRVDKARTRESGGTGLGLAIAKHAVESQGGELFAESQVGSGSKFSIKLPIAARGGSL